MDSVEFTKGYIDRLISLLKSIDACVVSDIIDVLNSVEKARGKLYIIGNGGSAATASHMANDFGPGLRRRGIMNFDAYSLADNSSVCTAIANDTGYDNIFYMQLLNNLRENDVLIAISCSGNSPNIIKAVEYAKETGAVVIGVSGFGGGRLKELADIKFHVDAPDGEYGLVEDVHMILDHIIYSYYIEQGAK